MNDPIASFVTTLERVMARLDPRQVDRDRHIPADTLRALAEVGAFGVSLPESHGGAGLGLAGTCRVVSALARRDRAVATTVGLHLGLGTRGLVAFGTDLQRDRYLPALASGRTLAAFATTEPGAGSDLTRLDTRATLRDGRLTVTGEKSYVTNGGLASLFTLTASAVGFPTPGRVLLLAERQDPGLSVGREEDKLGLRGSSTTPVHLDLDLPLHRLLGPPDRGPDQLAHILAWGRTAMAAGCCGTAEAALAMTLAHVESRHQFGRPLASQPIVRDQLAAMAARLLTMRALVAETAAIADMLDDEPGSVTLAHRLELYSLAAKVFASDGDWFICDLAVQLHGGSGYLEETGVALLLRDARITRIFEGANDVLLTRLGQLELTLKTLTTGPAAAPLLALRELGLKVLRDPRRLHRAGRLTALGLAHAAIAHQAKAPSPPDPLAQHARALLEHALGVLWLEADLDDAPALELAHLSPPNPPRPPHPGVIA